MAQISAPALLFLAVTPLAGQCALEIGTIADLKGVWTEVASHHTFVKNDVLCLDSKVQRVNDSTASAEDFLQITSRSDSRQTVTFECKALFSCEKPLDLTPLVNEEQRRLKGSGVLESFASWRKSHERRASTVSRGDPPPDKPILRTAVIEAGKPMPAGEVFRTDAPAGKYQLDFCDLSTDEACGKTEPSSKEFAWQPGMPGNLPFPAPQPGVHLLFRVRDDDPAVRTGDRVLVIAVHSSNANRIAETRDKIAIATLAVSPDDTEQTAIFEDYVRSIGGQLATRR